MTVSYIIADLRLTIDIPARLAALIPASFAPFRASDADTPAPADLRIKIRPAAAGDFSRFDENPTQFGEDFPKFGTVEACLDRTTNDLGTIALYQIPSGYLFTLQSGETRLDPCTVEASLDPCTVEACLDPTKYDFPPAGGAAMVAEEDFSAVEIAIDPSSAGASAAINSLTRIAFSQMVLLHGGISVHASAVVSAGRAILFLGPSGTGKSTHARLWTDTIPATTLLNDDNPIIRIHGAAFAYGSPWSGKTPCHLPRRAPLKAIVRLRQAAENHFTPLSGIDAFTNLLPSCSAIKTSALLHDAMLDTLQRIISLTDNGLLHCRPDPQAALICHSALKL